MNFNPIIEADVLEETTKPWGGAWGGGIQLPPFRQVTNTVGRLLTRLVISAVTGFCAWQLAFSGDAANPWVSVPVTLATAILGLGLTARPRFESFRRLAVLTLSSFVVLVGVRDLVYRPALEVQVELPEVDYDQRVVAARLLEMEREVLKLKRDIKRLDDRVVFGSSGLVSGRKRTL